MDKNINEIVYRIVDFLLEQPYGTEISIREAYGKVFGEEGYEWIRHNRKGWVSSSDGGKTYLIEDMELFSVLEKVEKMMKSEGRVFDFSKWDDMAVGLPYNIEFVIREKKHRKVFCPKCKSENVAPIIYGMPTYSTFKRAERGEFFLGGCEIMPCQPDYKCRECGYSWSKEMLPATAIKKVRYIVTSNGLCAVEDMKKWVYEVYPDGKCKLFIHSGRERKPLIREEEIVSNNRVIELYRGLQKLVKKYPDELIVGYVCDGCSYELQITYSDNRKEVINGDVGGGDFDELMEKFVHKVFDVE